MEIKINNIKGITVSEIAKAVSLNPVSVKASLRRKGINPIAYIGQRRLFS
jgi:hypothetical protein